MRQKKYYTKSKKNRISKDDSCFNRFSIGYNFDHENFMKLMHDYSDHLESVYFPPPRKYIGSGRLIPEDDDYDGKIIDIFKGCIECGIKPFLLLNSTIISSDEASATFGYLRVLYKKGFLSHVTVTDPYLITRIEGEMPDVFIEASALCRIQTEQEARYFKEIGVRRMTTDRETIRNIPLLKKLAKILPVKVLANEACLKDCIFRYAHYDFLSGNRENLPLFAFSKGRREKKRFIEANDAMCVPVAKRHPHKFFSSPFIRPEDLYRYGEVTNVFKLSTRNFDTARIRKTLDAYINMRHDGNLIDILNSVYTERIFSHVDNRAINGLNFFETLSGCSDDCKNCSYCKDLLLKAKVKMKR